jgi:glucose/arabinose dehydrogenase
MDARRHATGPATALLLVGGLVGVLVAACGAPAATGVPSVSTPVPVTAPPTAQPEPSASEVATVGPVETPPTGDQHPDLAAVSVATEPVVSGLAAPLWVTSVADDSGRLYVAEQDGRIRIVQDGQLLPTPYLDISDRVLSAGERGLLGVAFPPSFGDERSTFYVHYSDRNGNTTVSAFDAGSGASPTVDPSTERVVLTQDQPYANHNGGWIGFDADGMLLIGLGDGGSGGDPENRASNLGTLLGKMLRIDVLGAPDGTPYLVPPNNPFVSTSGARPEILHYGLRNPFRDSVDLETGALWIGDVGQNAWEEVDVAPAGASGLDLGWRRWEGLHCYNPATDCDPTGVTMPVAEYGHDAGCSVIGGVVYRGDEIPALRGAYLFSDYCSGTLWAIDASSGGPQTPTVILETGRNISSIGTDDAGEVYLTDISGGELLRLTAAG